MIKFQDHPEFTPDYTPEEMARMGVFSGTYYRRIYCVLNERYYQNAHLEFPWGHLYSDVLTLSEDRKRPDLNYYKRDVGTSLEFWHSKGWINAQDPYGWYQWYCRFYHGRRSSDDQRQIKRWIGVRKRFRREGPVWDQIRLHWAISQERNINTGSD